MARTLLRIPKMFTKDDLSKIDPRIPEDYDAKAKEFWDYVGDRFSAVSGRLKKIYLESTGVMGRRLFDMLKIADPLQHEVLKAAMDSGAEVLEAEDPELVLETISWMQKMQELIMARTDQDEDMSAVRTIGELLQESMRERDESVKKKIETSLQEGEVGALIMDTTREIEFSEDIRVVTTCPFQPRDYLNSWLAGLQAKDRAAKMKEKAESEEKSKGDGDEGQSV